MSREISASKFKAECLAILDEVAGGGDEVVVTKRGRAVARVVPAVPPAGLLGSVRFNVSDEDLLAPLGPPWDAERA
jgi:prevent-host-death family protein